ncbi:MAG: hypothetical protein JNL50_05810 [Phycisphaerae bacterium]|nr:hypothetical protein [Phycisphaerae bacterium]
MLATCVSAQPWSFTRIVDTDTPVPGGFETYTGFSTVSIENDRVAFIGSDSAFRYGVYDNIGHLTRVIADRNTNLPDSNEKFSNDIFFHLPGNDVGGGTLSFFGAGTTRGGLYGHDGVSLRTLVDNTFKIPNSGENFAVNTPRHDVSGTDVVFGAEGMTTHQAGIYRRRGDHFEVIADKTMSPPGHAETFTNFVDWRLEGDATCFTAATSNGYAGIFRSQGGQLTKIMDSNDTDPDGHRLAFPQYVRPAGANTVFNAYTDNNVEGIYIKTGSGIDKLVDETMVPPDGSSATYNGIGTLDYQNNTLIFQAGNDVIYTNYGGTMQRLIGPGDTLDGKRVIAAVFDEHGFDGTTAAFWVIFAGDSSFHYDRAIYTVTIPVPGALGTAALGVFALSRRRR